jgi:hypothetical protein
MSASRSARTASPKKARSVAVTAPPWTNDDIDYGPANVAARDLAIWALALAERDVEDWPAARKRVRNARKFVLARLSGNDRRMPVEDVIFTASLLARIFDDDLGLGLADSLSIFDSLDLPSDIIPIPPPRPRSPATGARPGTRALDRIELVPPPLRFCDECGYVHEPGLHVGYRNAA